MINNLALVGRITKDIDLKYTSNGIAVSQNSLAVERPFKNAQGEKETDFINFVAWRKTAEILSQYAHKVAMIGIVGRIQTRNYQNNEGRTIYITEVAAENIQLIQTNRNEQQSHNQSNYQKNNQNNNQQNNYSNNQQNKNQNNDPFKNNPETIDISDDDLPF